MKLKISKIYKIGKYKAICVKKTKSGKYRMQTFGMTSGEWPGEGNLSNYNDTTKAFIKEFGTAISRFRLPTKEEMMTLPGIYPALIKAAKNYSSFVADDGSVWLGTVYDSSGAYCVHFYGNVYYDYRIHQYVVAPAFNLDPSKVILEGKEIKLVEVAESEE